MWCWCKTVAVQALQPQGSHSSAPLPAATRSLCHAAHIHVSKGKHILLKPAHKQNSLSLQSSLASLGERVCMNVNRRVKCFLWQWFDLHWFQVSMKLWLAWCYSSYFWWKTQKLAENSLEKVKNKYNTEVIWHGNYWDFLVKHFLIVHVNSIIFLHENVCALLSYAISVGVTSVIFGYSGICISSINLGIF